MSTTEPNPSVEQLKADVQTAFTTLKTDVQAVIADANIPERVDELQAQLNAKIDAALSAVDAAIQAHLAE